MIHIIMAVVTAESIIYNVEEIWERPPMLICIVDRPLFPVFIVPLSTIGKNSVTQIKKINDVFFS